MPRSLLLLLTACWSPDGPPSAPAAPPEADRCSDTTPGVRCWASVPGATFLMGAQATDPSAPGYDAHAASNEGPPHEVTVAPFWIYKSELSASAFGTCLKSGACGKEDVSDEGGFSTFKLLEADARISAPITGITWDGAKRLCGWLGGRLPTEAEWELAARGTDGRAFPWGNDPACGVSKYVVGPPPDPNVDRREMLTGACTLTGPVLTQEALGASPYGVIGMGGNVWEWVDDAYGPYGGAPSSEERVQRGGGWTLEDPWDLRAAARGHMRGSAQINDVGVRCVFGG